MQKVRKSTLSLIMSFLIVFVLSLAVGMVYRSETPVNVKAEDANDAMLHWAPKNGDYAFGALLNGKGAEGMCLEFDLYETNFRDPSHVTNPSNFRIGFEYAKSNLQYFDIGGNDLQNSVQFFPDNTFQVVHSGGNPTMNDGLTIEGDPALFMVPGYRYRVEIRGGAALSLGNYFVASRRPISDTEGNYEQIVAFNVLPGYVADRGNVDPTYAGMVTKSGVTMNLDNIYIGRTAGATTNCISQSFNAADLTFNKGVEVHDADGYTSIDVYNPSWQAYVGNYEDLYIFYWIDTKNPSVNDTEYNLIAAPEKNVQVTFEHNGSVVATVNTYAGGIVKAPVAPKGYHWNLENVDLTNVAENVTIGTIVNPDDEGTANKVLDWNPGSNVCAFGALLDGSIGSCVEFDLYDSNFWSLNDGSIDGLNAAARMYKPQITFAYGRSALRVVEIFGSNIQNVIQFFPNGEFNDVTHDGNPVAISPEMVDGDASLFMQPGYSYRVEMRTSEAAELPNSFVVSRKEIAAPASYYEKILSFDLIAPQFARGSDPKTYVAVETRGGVRMTIDNVAISRGVNESVVKTADFNDGSFDQGTPCSELPAYAAAGASVVADGYEGKFGEISVFYWGNSWYTPSERKILDKPFEHTLTFRVEGQDDFIVNVYDGAIFTGPKEEAYEYTWDTASAEIDLTNITKSAVITGTKTGAKRTITFIPGRGTGNIDPIETAYNEKVKLNGSGFSREGYTLSGWAVSATGSKVYEADETIVVTKDLTLYALWTKNTYTVTFKDGETVLATVSVEHGQYVEYPEAAPSKEGYTFKGWDFDIENTAITGDVAVNAVFEKVGGEKGGCMSNVFATGSIFCVVFAIAGVVMILRKRREI